MNSEDSEDMRKDHQKKEVKLWEVTTILRRKDQSKLTSILTQGLLQHGSRSRAVFIMEEGNASEVTYDTIFRVSTSGSLAKQTLEEGKKWTS